MCNLAKLKEWRLKVDLHVPHRSRTSKLPANPSVLRLGIGAILLVAICGGASPAVAQPMASPQEIELRGFQGRLQQFVDLKRTVEDRLPDVEPSSDPARVEARQRALAQALQEARLGAKQGDVFGENADEIRRIVQQDARRRGARDVYAAMKEVPRQQSLQVNMEYPKDEPLATVPPLLLARLPRLPDGLEYRFIGRDLILRDATTNLVIDFIRQAVPPIRR